MSRMFDRLLASGFGAHSSFREHVPYCLCVSEIKEVETRVMGNLEDRHPVVVEADNVAQYLYADLNRTWKPKDLPNVAPAWPRAFIEFAIPPCLDRAYAGTRRAVLVESCKADHPSVASFVAARQIADAEWVQRASVFMEAGRGDISLLGTTGWGVRADGSVIATDSWAIEMHGLKALEEALEKIGERERAQGFAEAIASDFILPAVYVAALTYSFINCRNTVLHDCAPPPRLAKANARRGKELVTYKVLEIEPIKRILAEQGQAEKNGLKQALHICRGHFKDYRERGLFGKAKGLFWWDMHVRGTAESGVVVKDYAAPAREGGAA